MALGLRGGIDARAAGHVLGVASAVVLLVACYAYAATGLSPRRRPWAALASWLVLCHPALVRWAESGLESTLFAATVTLALALPVRAPELLLPRLPWAFLLGSLAAAGAVWQLVGPAAVALGLVAALLVAPTARLRASCTRTPISRGSTCGTRT